MFINVYNILAQIMPFDILFQLKSVLPQFSLSLAVKLYSVLANTQVPLSFIVKCFSILAQIHIT